jgi:hypothetical protein
VLLPEGKISELDFNMFHVTDSPSEVVEIVRRSQSTLIELVSDDIGIPG